MRLSGKNFQAWADFSVSIDGLTVITGPSDAGKSSLFRALRGVLRNELPAEFIRDGQDEALSVTCDYDNHTITAHRSGKGSTKYVIDDKDYAKLAGGVPDALKDLKFGEVVIGDFDIDPIFGRQNSAQFLIDPASYKPAEVNAILGAFGGTEKLEAGKKEANLRKTQKDAEARNLATQIRDAEESKAALLAMHADAERISTELHTLEASFRELELKVHWLDAAVHHRLKITPLRQVMDALVLPDVTGLDELARFILYADQAAEATAYAKWLIKPIAALSSVAAAWTDVRSLWNQIAAVEGAIAAGKHVISQDQINMLSNVSIEWDHVTHLWRQLVAIETAIKTGQHIVDTDQLTSLSSAGIAYSEAILLWRSITALEVLAALLGDITDSAEKLAGVEIELSAAQAELQDFIVEQAEICPTCKQPIVRQVELDFILGEQLMQEDKEPDPTESERVDFATA